MKHKKLALAIAGTLIFVFGVLLITPRTISYEKPPPVPEEIEPIEDVRVPTTTKAVAPKLEPTTALRRICSCESTGRADGTPRQFNADGSVLRGKVNPQDIGACQINATYHEETARSLGFNIYTLEGNIGYAVWLYDRQGAKPWSWSTQCHGQY